ncbi:MAG: hypothetical protein WA971_08815 [Microbacterium sp.]
MMMSHESDSRGAMWSKILFGIAVIGFGVSLIGDGFVWWNLATSAGLAVLGMTLIAVGIRDLARSPRLQRPGDEIAEPHPDRPPVRRDVLQTPQDR